jgi:hypothetical protein
VGIAQDLGARGLDGQVFASDVEVLDAACCRLPRTICIQ